MLFDLRRIALWLVVLLVPGGILLLPLLVADMRRNGQPQLAAKKPFGEDPTPNDDPKRPPSDSRLPRLAA